MSIRIEIFDGTTPLIEKIQLLSHGMALESLSVAGSIVQQKARNAMTSKRHNWHQVLKDGELVSEKGISRELGLRISHGGLGVEVGSPSKPSSMSRMITSYLNEKAMLVTIGGRHKAFTPKERKDGVVTGNMDRVYGVSKSTHAILHKLNFGGYADAQLPDYEKGKGQFPNKYIKYNGYKFMEEGLNNSYSDAIEALTTRYEALLHKAINRADIKVKTRIA